MIYHIHVYVFKLKVPKTKHNMYNNIFTKNLKLQLLGIKRTHIVVTSKHSSLSSESKMCIDYMEILINYSYYYNYTADGIWSRYSKSWLVIYYNIFPALCFQTLDLHIHDWNWVLKIGHGQFCALLTVFILHSKPL